MIVRTAFVAVAVSAALVAQDLQPGRNFPTAAEAFGGGSGSKTQELDVGDIDLDGDLDVLVGNGAHGCFCEDRIFVNLGGLQGGTEGTFADETATRFAGFPAEKGRDIEFVDYDGDGDLDVFVSNRGGNTVGAISRFYDNAGGAQGGTLGFYLEATDARWGVSKSVSEFQQPTVDDCGPWEGWSRDADFADLDLDGDVDLLLTSQGPAFNGTRPTRLFFNDGTGVFHELWPWADGAADVELHAVESQLVDLDGDLDLDLFVASRDSQSRVYLNTLNDGPTSSSAFVDVTQSALIDNGAQQAGSSTYAVELIDPDGDDDFDLWVVNYQGFEDRILRNRSEPGELSFTKNGVWITDDPAQDEEGASVVDYDGDGDLDMFMPNFSGTNHLHRSELAQTGLPFLHRTGVGAEPPETPASLNGGTTLDGEAADLDGDGDDDLLLANDGNQANRVWFNELGVPDTHAPRVIDVESVDDRPLGFGARVTASLRDNHGWAVIAFHDVELLFSVDAGPETPLPMTSIGGQQFVAFLPGDVAGTITYRVRATDAAGNVGTSDAQSFVQGLQTPWAILGGGAPGANGLPRLEGAGSLVAGEPGALSLDRADAHAQAALFVGTGAGAASFKGGTFVPLPVIANLSLVTDGWGRVELPWAAWPAGVPSGTELVFQVWVADAAASKGVAGSNAVRATTP